MANEFIIRKGFKSLQDSELTGSLNLSGNIVADGTVQAEFASGTSTAISGAFDSVSSSLSSELLKNTTDTLTGDLTVTGTLTAQDLHVQEVTSSIVFSSGSNKFGENVSDTQKFTGSLQVSGSIDLEDNAKIKIGTGNDLQIYHDGSNSYINEAGTGVLSIQSDGTEVQINKGASEYMGRFIADAGVKLYYNNSLKFETLDTGVDVTGDINIDAGKKLAYSSTAFMTPENNTTGAEISTLGDFRVKTGNPPTLALTLGGSQGATFAGTVEIGASSATNLSLGSNSTDFELSAKKDGTDAISMVFKTQASGGALGEAMRITSGGDIGINYSGPFNQISGTETTLAISNGNVAALYLNNTHSNGHRWILTSGTDGAFGFYDKTEGATRMVIDSSGTIIGTGTYSAASSIKIFEAQRSGGAVAGDWSYDDATTDMSLGTSTSHSFSLKTGDTRALTINSSGNVGINTTAPSTKLHIDQPSNDRAGGLYIERNGSSYGLAAFVNSGGYGIIGGGGSYANDVISIDFNNAYVGIGADNPSGTLDIRPNSSCNYVFDGTSTSGYTTTFNMDDTGLDIGHNSASRSLNLKTNSLDRLTILGGGNVGIGTTSPSNKLQVNGDVAIDTSANSRLRFYQGGTFKAGIQAVDTGGQMIGSSAADDLAIRSQSNMLFSTGGNTERMRIDSSGNVGIGTDSPTGKLSVETNGNHLHLRANTATAGKYWNFDITSDNQLYIVNNGGTGIQVLDNGKVGIGGTPDYTLDVAGEIGLDSYIRHNGDTDTFFGFSGNDEIKFRTAGSDRIFINSSGNVGIGTTNPFAPLQVNGTHSTLNAHFGQGTNNTNGVFGGISLGYTEGNASYRKVGIVAQAKGDSAARQDLHFLVDTVADGNSAGIADSKMMIAHDTGYVGIATAAPAAPLHVHGNIQSKEGIISPTFYVARNYGSTSGNFAGYDDIAEGDIIDIKDHSIGSLNAFAHGQTDPIINGSSDSIDWNYFRLLFRYTNNSATYTNYTVGFKVARYFYSSGWTENSAEFSGNGMDGARGPRWAVSPWVTTGGTDVPGIGLKYYDNYTHTQTIRVHAIYIQYKS